ncbi:PH-interacting protein, partial [Nymphaea thermarum]
SSDDGTCRIWDARSSSVNPRIYLPKPPETVAVLFIILKLYYLKSGKSNEPSQASNQRNHQILCCAFNANGTVFVTGSSDTYARVWNACKANSEDSDQPNHELDVLAGHENDVNYVQFSGCAVASRSATTDASREENVPKFKNSWFTHDNIVTCSRDGSAIIWIPRSRRSHKNAPITMTYFSCVNANRAVQIEERESGRIKKLMEDENSCCRSMGKAVGDGRILNIGQRKKCSNQAMEKQTTFDTPTKVWPFAGEVAIRHNTGLRAGKRWTKVDGVALTVRLSSEHCWSLWGKVGRWTRAYHLKVPPPPMPPQPARGGPRQRFLPTPRGVNMIVWSLDNRFVLAAIMDCRICVWNAADGSLVHSLTGHSQSTYVLDVHPFNPRIAMSAGYDGKTIVWDIWEGIPVRTYDIGRFKLVDGKFSPDGTSIVLSDEVGQIYILATGQGESQKDAKYDQFFLGDYRPLIQDTNGNVLDQETQLQPYRRNMQDLLCDYGMYFCCHYVFFLLSSNYCSLLCSYSDPELPMAGLIPYPDPYQSMYQQRRLGALGIEWRPPSVNLAVGPVDFSNLGIQDYRLHFPQVHLDGDLDRWLEQPTEFTDVIDWEPQDNDIQSDDNDSEYNVTEESSSEGEHVSISASSSEDSLSGAEDSDDAGPSNEHVRRSKRKKRREQVEFITSFGRRVKRRNLDDHDSTFSQSGKSKKRKNGPSSRKKKGAVKSSRPQRVAARNALNLFSRIGGVSSDGEEDADSGSVDGETVKTDSNILSNGSGELMHLSHHRPVRENGVSPPESTVAKVREHHESQIKTGAKKRLVVKFPLRDSKKLLPSEGTSTLSHAHGNRMTSVSGASEMRDPQEAEPNAEQQVWPIASLSKKKSDPKCVVDEMVDTVFSANHSGKPPDNDEAFEKIDGHQVSSTGQKDSDIKWGEVKVRTSKRLRLGDASAMDAWPLSSWRPDIPEKIENNGSSQQKSIHDSCLVSDESGRIPYVDKATGEVLQEVKLHGKEKLGVSASLRPDAPGHSWHPAAENTFLMNDKYEGDDRAADGAHEMEEEAILNTDEKFLDQSISVKDNELSSENILEVSSKIVKSKEKHLEIKYQNENAHNFELNGKMRTVGCKLKIKSRQQIKESCGSSAKMQDISDDWKGSDSKVLPRSPRRKNENETFAFSGEGDSGTEPSLCHGEWDEIKDIRYKIDKQPGTSTSYDCRNSSPDRSKKLYAAAHKSSKSSWVKDDPDLESVSYMEENIATVKRQSQDIRGSSMLPADSYKLRTTGKSSIRFSSRGSAPCDLKAQEECSFSEKERRHNLSLEDDEQFLHDDWRTSSRTSVGLRSSRSRRASFYGGEQSFSDRKRTLQPVRKHSWLTLSEHEAGYRYIPQKGDEVAYLRQGHQEFLELSRLQDTAPWRLHKNLRAVEFCSVRDLEYSSLPGSGESCCKLSLEFNDPSSNLFGKTFRLTLPELTDFPDFLVERSRFDAAMSRNWTHRDKCQVWWRCEGGEGGSWWEGRILAVKPKLAEFPDSPWERCIIQYKSDSSGQHLHSPWELHDGPQWEHPQIDDRTKRKLISSFHEIECISNKSQDHYGLQKLLQVAVKCDFLNRFPVPLSFDLIKTRLENGYYRSVEAFKHDLTVMLFNAQAYFGKSAEMSNKMRRLAECIGRSFSL